MVHTRHRGRLANCTEAQCFEVALRCVIRHNIGCYPYCGTVQHSLFCPAIRLTRASGSTVKLSKQRKFSTLNEAYIAFNPCKRMCDKCLTLNKRSAGIAFTVPEKTGGRPHPNPLPEGEGICHTGSKSVFNKFGPLSKSGFQAHPSFLRNQGDAPTLTLPRRERGFVTHPLRLGGKHEESRRYPRIKEPYATQLNPGSGTP